MSGHRVCTLAHSLWHVNRKRCPRSDGLCGERVSVNPSLGTLKTLVEPCPLWLGSRDSSEHSALFVKP